MTTEPRPLPPVARCSDDDWRAYLDGAPVAMTRDVVDVEGPEAGSYLQVMLSQDVATLGVGESRWAMLLQPTGKLVAHLRVRRAGESLFELDTDPGAGEVLAQALRRFLLRTKAVVGESREATGLHVAPSATGGEIVGAQIVGAQIVGADPILGGVDVVDVIDSTHAGLLSPAVAEVARIAAGLPVQGAELDSDIVPNSTGLLQWAVSFTKGCYPGQELVERIDSRGATTPVRLVRIAARPGDTEHDRAGDQGLATSDTLGLDGAGTVTSLAWCDGVLVGLARVQRTVATGALLHLGGTVFEVLGDVGA